MLPTALLINGTKYPLKEGVNSIGHKQKSDVCIRSAHISTRHAEIEISDLCFVRDLESSNGTKIKDQLLRPNYFYQVKEGDEIYFANQKAVLIHEDLFEQETASEGEEEKEKRKIISIEEKEQRPEIESSQIVVSTELNDSTSKRRKSRVKYKVLFTGIKMSKNDSKKLKEIGGEIVESIQDCDIVVTDKIRRTVKFLCAVSSGKSICSLVWIKESFKSKEFLDPLDFILSDKEQEQKFKFNLAESLERAQNQKLFAGIHLHATENVKPEPIEIREMLEISGGVYVTDVDETTDENIVVVSCARDLRKLKVKTKKIMSTEFVLTGILRQSLDFESYLL